MEELIAELRKLKAEVSIDPVFASRLIVHGQIIAITVKQKNNKPNYLIGGSSKSYTTARNAAYYIITEYLPMVIRLREMRSFIEKARQGLPEGANVFMMADGEVRIKCRDSKQLLATFQHLARKQPEGDE
mgnify:CR=1 FL=1